MSDIDSLEKEEVKNILKKFFPKNNYFIDNLEITLETYVVLGEMMNEAKKCTEAMHLVPRPGIPVNPLSYAKKELRNSIRRYLLSDQGKFYTTCLTGVSAKYRSALQLASFN